MSKAANAYLATQVNTTSQGQLLVMLYDAGIKFLKQAKEYMIAKDYAKKGILISRAMDIITELASSLNKDKGGQIAENLQSLYTFCNIQLAQANMKMDTKKLDDVIGILSNLRNAYAEILPQVEGDQSGKAQAARRQAGMAASSVAAATAPPAAPKPQAVPAPKIAPKQTAAPAPAPDPIPAKTPAPTPGPEKAPAQPQAATESPAAPQPGAMPKLNVPQQPKPPVNPALRRAANAYGVNS